MHPRPRADRVIDLLPNKILLFVAVEHLVPMVRWRQMVACRVLCHHHRMFPRQMPALRVNMQGSVEERTYRTEWTVHHRMTADWSLVGIGIVDVGNDQGGNDLGLRTEANDVPRSEVVAVDRLEWKGRSVYRNVNVGVARSEAASETGAAAATANEKASDLYANQGESLVTVEGVSAAPAMMDEPQDVTSVEAGVVEVQTMDVRGDGTPRTRVKDMETSSADGRIVAHSGNFSLEEDLKHCYGMELCIAWR
jgi:hypothetical protein